MLSKFVDRTFLKFVLVGVANTVVGTGVMFLCYNLFGMSYWASSVANYVVGSIMSYFLNKYFTFKSNGKSIKEVALFVANIVVCYVIAYAVAKPMMAHALADYSVTIQENVAMLVGASLFVILNYAGQRFVVFKNRNTDK